MPQLPADIPSRLRHVVSAFVTPALAALPDRMDTPQARVMLLAIGLQESRFLHTHQIGGPAHSYLQFERGGGVRGVLRHNASRAEAVQLCKRHGINADEGAAFDLMEHDQVFAMSMGRLLLWTDPKPLPRVGDEQSAWSLYLRTWRPGKPHRSTWDDLYAQAVTEVRS